MTRDRRADCCEYREERRKLAVRRSRRKMERTRRVERIDGCDEDEEETEQRRRCEEAKADGRGKPPKYVSRADESMGRIKPSIGDREKYLAARHARCLFEAAEIEKSPRAPSVDNADPCRSARGSKRRKRGKTTEDARPSKVNSEREKEDEGQEGQDGRKTATERKRRRRRVEKYSGGESDGSESRRKKKSAAAESRADGLTESDCEDSICSFDSQINLSGLALTEEEIERIEKTRRSGVRSATGK